MGYSTPFTSTLTLTSLKSSSTSLVSKPNTGLLSKRIENSLRESCTTTTGASLTELIVKLTVATLEYVFFSDEKALNWNESLPLKSKFGV